MVDGEVAWGLSKLKRPETRGEVLLREANDVVFLGVLGDRGEELCRHRKLRGRGSGAGHG